MKLPGIEKLAFSPINLLHFTVGTEVTRLFRFVDARLLRPTERYEITREITRGSMQLSSTVKERNGWNQVDQFRWCSTGLELMCFPGFFAINSISENFLFRMNGIRKMK